MEEPQKHAGGRPTIFTPELVAKALEYLESAEDEEVQELTGLSAKGTELYKNKLKVNLPSIEGLALYLGVNRDTLYAWSKEHPEFSDILADLRAKQAKSLIDKGLSGDYNSTIAKLILSKHGYVEKSESDVMSGGERIQGVVVLPHKNNNEDTLATPA